MLIDTSTLTTATAQTAWADGVQAKLADELATFVPITLNEMTSVALLDRVEVKYLFHIKQLPTLLHELQSSYAVLSVAGQRLNRYQTLYFDTEDFALYHRHHMGARNRYKIRSRKYIESGYSFLEVKHKTNKQRTIKSRIATPELVSHLEDGAADFLSEACPYRVEELAPRLWNHYVRITLVNLHDSERVTLDIDLHYAWDNRQMGVPMLVVAEVKQAGHLCTSPFVTLMRQYGIRKSSFSKYCVGVSLLYPNIKHNKFKITQRRIAKALEAKTPEAQAHQDQTNGEKTPLIDHLTDDLFSQAALFSTQARLIAHSPAHAPIRAHGNYSSKEA